MSSASTTIEDLWIHILDVQARDIRIESETAVAREVVYESADEEVDSEEEAAGYRRRRAAATATTNKREFVIHLFGATATGQSVRLDVEGFRPTLYLRLPDDTASRTRAAIEALRTYMTIQGIPLSQLTLKQVLRKKFYGFSANKDYPFLEITTPSLALWRNIKNLFLDESSRPATKKPLPAPYKSGESPEVYEANFDPMLRFFHVQKLNSCGWIKVAGGVSSVEDTGAIQWIAPVHYTDVQPAIAPGAAPSAPFLEASWDIECYSATGDFPLPTKTWVEFATTLLNKKVSLQDGLDAYTTLTRPKKIAEKLAAAPFQTRLAVLTANGDAEELGIYLKKQIGEWVVLGDPVIQIGTTLSRNSVPFERHLFVFPNCDPIDGIVVHAFPTEKEMIEGYFAWLVEINPDTLMGYNVFGFDEKYLWKRAEELGCTSATGAVHGLSRLLDTGAEVKLEEKRLSSSALGDNFLYMWTTAGRLQVDMFQYIKRSASLPSYKLDEVTKHYLSGKLKKTKRERGAGGAGAGAGASASASTDLLVLELSGAVKDLRAGRALCLLDETGDSLTDKMVIVEVRAPGVVAMAWPRLNDDEVEEEDLKDVVKWVVVKDDVGPHDIFRLHRGDAADRAIVGKYCLQDCDLVLELYRKLEVFNNSMSMANVCCVPISYIFTRGQGVKIESLMFRACRERDTLIPVLPAPRQPGSGGSEEDSYEGAIVLDPVPGFYSQSPVGVADFASLYPSTIESENISHDSLVWTKDFDYSGKLIGVVYDSGYDEARATADNVAFTDIEFDIWRPDPADKRKHPEKKKCGLRICRYAQPLDGSKSTLPEIIRGLLAARKAKRMEGERETDPGRKALLDAEQLAYKLTANSLYGQLGSGTFKIRLQALAASVTAYGRKQILFAKAVIERFYGGGAMALGGRVKCDARCEAKVVYGDSVTGDTPLMLKQGENAPYLSRMDELLTDREWQTYHDTKEAVDISTLGLSVWTERGYTPIRRIIRHKLAPTKKLFRILTHTGVADVTEDHSLVLKDGTEVKPEDVTLGTELLHSDSSFTSLLSAETTITVDEAFVMGFFMADGSADVYAAPSGTKATWAINKANMELLEEAQRRCPFETKILDTLASSGVYKLVPVGNIMGPARKYRALFYNAHREKRIPAVILNAPLEIARSFWDGFYAGDGDHDPMGFTRVDQKGKEVCMGIYLLARRLGYKVSLTDRADKPTVFRLTMTTKSQRKNPIAIKKIRELPHPGPDAYVYDLETENHHFAVGPGALVVHNTDSLFVEFSPIDPTTGERITGRDGRQAVIDLTAEAGHLVTQALAPPHDFEFDKVFDPMLMFSKKRYAGCMFEENADDFVYKYMGIALKRRDNAPVVKAIFGKAMKKLLNERDIAGATTLVQQMSMDLVNGKTSLGQLTISKSLRADYADPTRIAHKALADRIAIRDPGNAPASGDRIPYVYIRPAVGAEAAKLQGDRIETPSYVREKGLTPDYEFYLEHQIQNPVSQMFGLLLEGMPGFRPDMLARAPTEPERLLVFRELVAAEILFKKAYEACRGDKKRAYVEKFFGVKAVAKPTMAPKAPSIRGSTPKSEGAGAGAGASTGATSRPTQATLSAFSVMSNHVRDGLLMDQMTKEKMKAKREATKREKEKAVAAEAAGAGAKAAAVEEETKDKKVIALPTSGSLVADMQLVAAFAKKKKPRRKMAAVAAADATDDDET